MAGRRVSAVPPVARQFAESTIVNATVETRTIDERPQVSPQGRREAGQNDSESANPVSGCPEVDLDSDES
jgi:hypothetical protein